VVISPDGRRAYVTNFDYPDFQTDGTVTVVDLPRS
jgi:DNA-binding beta-propeller fold protein YncE